MRRNSHLKFEFVEFIPENIKEGYIYISIEYATAVHKCCCGCGSEVVTPLSPSDWSLLFDGESISLHPSIGNWSFKCHSHYFIRNNNVIWLPAQPKKIELPQESMHNSNKYDRLPKNIWKRVKKWWISS